ncbi:minor capsid protein [Neobacillus niacini]|uniref:minor capsid protein n=1 Tax=Neobacillus niacini TaxID=86668 RepID=UPI003B01F7DA
MNDQDKKTYWESRMEQLYASQDKQNDKFIKKMIKEYHRMEEDIKKDIGSYYTKYGKDDVIEYRKLVQSLSTSERDLLYKNYEDFIRRYPQYSNLLPVRESIYKLNRLEGLQLSIRLRMVELGAFEQEGLEKLLQQAYENGYLSSMNGLQNAPSFFSVNSYAMQLTLAETWTNGGNFSSRLWGNKSTLINTLNNEIRDGIIRGDDYRQMIKVLRHRTGVGEFCAKRLVVTETAFVMNQGNKQAFMDAGVKRYEISAVMDRRTSNICKRLNGEQFEFKDAKSGTNYPPFHAFCRSTAIPIEND